MGNPVFAVCRYYASIAMALLYDGLLSGEGATRFHIDNDGDEYDICEGSCVSQRVSYALSVVDQAAAHYRSLYSLVRAAFLNTVETVYRVTGHRVNPDIG